MSEAIPTKQDRRTAIRYPSRQKTAARLSRATGEGPWQVSVRNISSEGVGLISQVPFKKGMLLTIELPTKNGDKLSNPKPIKITHAAAQPGSKWWVVGGMFATRLSPEELETLV